MCNRERVELQYTFYKYKCWIDMQDNKRVHNLSAYVLNGERLVDVLAAGDGESPAVAVVVPRQLDRHVLRGHGDDCGRLDVAHPMSCSNFQPSP